MPASEYLEYRRFFISPKIGGIGSDDCKTLPQDKYDISMACNLISHLLTSSAPGSFIWKMKSLKYGFSARGSLSPVPRSFAMYSVTLYVSDKGLCERQKVAKLFFDYINTLKKSVSEKMWDNFFAEHKFKFQYREDTQTDKLAGSANNLLIKDPKWYLNSPEWAEKYNPGMIQMILGQIRGDNMNIVGLVGESILKETQPCVNTKFNRYEKFDNIFEHFSSLLDEKL